MLDLSRTPSDVQRDAAAVIREVLQTFPKTLPALIEPEEDTDER